MRVISIFSTAAALAATASAFLITPEIESNGLLGWKPSAGTIDVECRECPFLAADLDTSGKVEVRDAKNNIHLEFNTVGNSLYINGVPVYPWEGQVPVVTAHQVSEAENEIGSEERIGFVVKVAKHEKQRGGFHRSKYGHATAGDDVDFIQIEFTVLDIAGVPVKSPTVQLDLIGGLKSSEGLDAGLEIYNVQAMPYDPKQDRCDNARNPSMCRVANMFGERLRDILSDAKDRASGIRTWLRKPEHKTGRKPCGGRPFRSGDGPAPPRGRHGEDGSHGHPHGHGPHHHHHARVARIIHRIMRTFVMPALLGIAGGLAASALGMMAGQFISFLWFKFGRGGQRGLVENVRVYEIEVAEGEKVGLLVDEEALVEIPPPEYEESKN